MEGAPTLLVVDDDESAQSLLQATLEDAGFIVLVGTSGEEALQLFDKHRDAVRGLITDVNLGHGKSGWDVARHLRETSPEIPIVYITGGNAHEWPAQGVPGSVLVTKPFAPAQIISAVSSLLNTTTPQQSSE